MVRVGGTALPEAHSGGRWPVCEFQLAPSGGNMGGSPGGGESRSWSRKFC